MTILIERTQQRDQEDSTLAGWIVTLLPMVFLAILFVIIFRAMKQTRRRAEEAISLYKEMLAELRGIRAELEKKSGS